jgi:tetratricopeptide (TPR) repeat protein
MRIAALVSLMVFASPLLAQDTVFLKGKSKKDAVKGQIKSESTFEIKLATQTISSDDVEDVQYQVPTDTPMAVSVRIQYDGAMRAEGDSMAPGSTKRREKILEALKSYQDLNSKVKDKFFKRHMDYKSAHLHARLALEENAKPDIAIAELQQFIEKHPVSWQFPRAALTLAKFQVEKGDLTAAKKTYQKLAEADVTPNMKAESDLQVALLSVKTNEHAVALKRLEEIMSKMPKTHPYYVRAQVAKAECLVATEKMDDAIKLLKEMIQTSPEKNYQVKAAAHNALGYCYFQKKQYAEARWEFLWVDVVYNQDRDEHAKALFYLTDVFAKLNDSEKSQQCRQMLLNDKTFSGTEWQRKMAASQ